MPGIHVEALRVAPITGMTIIDKQMIEALPTRNGSVNEIIGIVPGVQYSEESLSSFTGGEITPPAVSISGSRIYDNNYTIDGVNNNNPLDPAFDSISNTYKLPGYQQMHFLTQEIIEQVTVYNSNIPAAFGGFTGGQIDTVTISPSADFWGRVNYRTTSDHWTKFHVHPLNKEKFDDSNYSDKQPSFRKQNFGMTLNTPLGIDTGLITSYQQLHSKIPLQHLDKSKDQSRKQEIFFTKLEHYFANNLNISLTALYTPTSENHFSRDFKESGYTLKSRNYSLYGKVDKQFSSCQLNVIFGYNRQKITRKAPTDRFFWSPTTATIDWDSGKEGGSGDLKTGQREFNLKPELSFNTLNWRQTSHKFKLGGEVTHSRQYYHRPKTSFYYYKPQTTGPINCQPNDIACIENEQYLTKRTQYSKTDTDANMTDVAAFIQDFIVWKRLEIIPGVRISYDDFSKNTNVAPRLATSLDVFGDQSTTLFAGLNRYYSGTLLTHALYEDIEIINQVRNDNNSDWENAARRPVTFRYETGNLKTPYSDELTLGIIQKVLGGELKFQYLKKKNKDEIARSRVVDPAHIQPDTYLINNLGRSEYESYQLSWQRSWVNHFLEINATWQETTTSHDNYTESLDADDVERTIWYKGKELHYYEIPRNDFNRPTIANLIYTYSLPHGITFTNTTKYRGGYWRLWNTRERKPSETNPGQSPDPYVYKKVKNHRSTTFDWRFSCRIPEHFKQDIVLSLDLLNVFDHKEKMGYQTGNYGYNYELGRQLWAGLALNF